MNHISPYLFGESTIRTIIRDQEPWFVINDICSVLDLTNSSMIKSRLHKDDLSTTYLIDNLGREQSTNICNESGLYQIIFQSRKAVARQFTRWVTSEVLPTIRRTGSYSPGHTAFLSLIRDQISLGVSPDLAARLAGKLCPAAAPESGRSVTLPKGSRIIPCDGILDAMTEETRYTPAQIIGLLPAGHPIHRMSPGRGQQTAVGKLLRAYVTSGHLQQEFQGSRNFYYRPQVIVPITAP